MNEWIEERCEALRLALRIGGFPGEADLYRLIDWLGPNVTLRHAPVPTASCRYRADGSAVITLPEDLYGEPLGLAMAHEVGHALLTLGMGALLRQIRPGDYATERLARRWDAQDERRAQDFLLAWLLPNPLVWRYREAGRLADLASDAHVRPELVEARLRSLPPRPFELREPPRWSAARQYAGVELATGSRMSLHVARRHGEAPAFVIPTDAATSDEDALQVTADLIALTTAEFERKYQPYRRQTVRAYRPDLSLLRNWAGGARR